MQVTQDRSVLSVWPELSVKTWLMRYAQRAPHWMPTATTTSSVQPTEKTAVSKQATQGSHFRCVVRYDISG